MKQTKEITEAKKWWRQINGTHKQLALGKKYFSGLDSGLTDDQIEFIYSREVIAMQPQETASSNDSLEFNGEPYFKGSGEHSVMILEDICEQYKEYCYQQQLKIQALKQSNKELIEALHCIINGDWSIDDARETLDRAKQL